MKLKTSIIILAGCFGIFLFNNGMLQFFPIKLLYFSSLGCTATATSPNIVSGLVVATIINLFLLIGYFIYHNKPFCSLCSTSKSDIAVSNFGSQLTNLLSLYINFCLSDYFLHKLTPKEYCLTRKIQRKCYMYSCHAT